MYVLGTPPINVMDAADVYAAADTNYYIKVPNTLTSVPKKGDLILWNRKVGKSGHIAISNGEGNIFWFNSFDQNWPTGSNAHIQRHSYVGVIGYLRKRSI